MDKRFIDIADEYLASIDGKYASSVLKILYAYKERSEKEKHEPKQN